MLTTDYIYVVGPRLDEAREWYVRVFRLAPTNVVMIRSPQDLRGQRPKILNIMPGSRAAIGAKEFDEIMRFAVVYQVQLNFITGAMNQNEQCESLQ